MRAAAFPHAVRKDVRVFPQESLQLVGHGVDCENRAVPVDQVGLPGGAAEAVLFPELRAVVHLQQVEPRIGVVFEGRAPGPVVFEFAGDAYYDEAPAAVFFVDGNRVSAPEPAGSAPRGPKVEQCDFSVDDGGERRGPAFGIGQCEVYVTASDSGLQTFACMFHLFVVGMCGVAVGECPVVDRQPARKIPAGHLLLVDLFHEPAERGQARAAGDLFLQPDGLLLVERLQRLVESLSFVGVAGAREAHVIELFVEIGERVLVCRFVQPADHLVVSVVVESVLAVESILDVDDRVETRAEPLFLFTESLRPLAVDRSLCEQAELPVVRIASRAFDPDPFRFGDEPGAEKTSRTGGNQQFVDAERVGSEQVFETALPNRDFRAVFGSRAG